MHILRHRPSMWHQIVNEQNPSKRNFTKHNVVLEVHIYRMKLRKTRITS